MNNYPSFKIDLPSNLKKRALANVEDALNNGQFYSGKYVKACEEQIKNFLGARYVFCTSSGSSALESCAYALRKKYNLGTVLIPMNTFVATSAAFERLGFNIQYYENNFDKVMFDGLNAFDPDAVGIVVVDLAGRIPENLPELIEEAHKRGLWVCEDACQAYGSSLESKKAGTFGDISALSFFSTKVVSSGEGGAVVTDNPDLATMVRMYRNFGKDEEWVSYHYAEGWNCRMNEFGAAVLLPQLEDAQEIIKNRNEIEQWYRKHLTGGCVQYPRDPIEKKFYFNGYKVFFYLCPKVNKEEFIERCRAEGVNFQGNVYDWILPEQPIYRQKRIVFNEEWRKPLKRMFCLPAWYGMTENEVILISSAITRALENMSKKEEVKNEKSSGNRR